MKTAHLNRAVEEAERFLARASELNHGPYGYVDQGPEAAAVRRSSLDLTKALAKLRSRD